MPMYEYQCSKCGEIHEEIRSMSERESDCVCPSCGGKAKFVVSTPQIKLEGISGSFPTAYDRWEKVRREKQAQERKFSAENGE